MRCGDPDQLDLPFPPIAGGSTWELAMSIDLPAAADRKTIERINRAGRRLRRGAVAGEAKLRKLAAGLEAIASLFDAGTR